MKNLEEYYGSDGTEGELIIRNFFFGKCDSEGKFIPARMELTRLAIPRCVYTQSHIDYVIEVIQEIVKEKDKTRGLKSIMNLVF